MGNNTLENCLHVRAWLKTNFEVSKTDVGLEFKDWEKDLLREAAAPHEDDSDENEGKNFVDHIEDWE